MDTIFLTMLLVGSFLLFNTMFISFYLYGNSRPLLRVLSPCSNSSTSPNLILNW